MPTNQFERRGRVRKDLVEKIIVIIVFLSINLIDLPE